MPVKHKIVYAIALLHIGLVALYAAHFAAWGGTVPEIKFVNTVCNYTGSNNIFSFFAPGLSNQPYVVFTIKDTKGKEKIIDFTGSSPDFTNRINDIYGYLTVPETRSVLSASLANAILRKYPEAVKIRVAMVVQFIPSTKDYRNGKRSVWHFWFNRDFQRDSVAVLQK